MGLNYQTAAFLAKDGFSLFRRILGYPATEIEAVDGLGFSPRAQGLLLPSDLELPGDQSQREHGSVTGELRADLVLEAYFAFIVLAE